MFALWKKNEIRKRCHIYDKGYLHAFNFTNELMETDFDVIYIQFGVITHELSKNYDLMSFLQGFDFGEFHKCNKAIFLLGDVFNMNVSTSLIFIPYGIDVEVFQHLVVLHTF